MGCSHLPAVLRLSSSDVGKLVGRLEATPRHPSIPRRRAFCDRCRTRQAAARILPASCLEAAEEQAIPRTTTAPSVLTDRHNIGASIQTENEYPISARQYPRFGTPTNIRRVSKKLPQTKTQTKRDF